MIGGNLGSLLYGDVSVMRKRQITCLDSKYWTRQELSFFMSYYNIQIIISFLC